MSCRVRPSCSGCAAVRLLEFRDNVRMPAAVELGLDPLEACDESAVRKSANLVLHERLEHQIGEWIAPPQAESRRERLRAFLGGLSARKFEQRVELHDVELLWPHTQPVTPARASR